MCVRTQSDWHTALSDKCSIFRLHCIIPLFLRTKHRYSPCQAVRTISGKAGTAAAAATKLYFDKDLCITRKQGTVRLELSAARS
jgi:hypothetical protein